MKPLRWIILLLSGVLHAAPPNIILILADDMGYECLSANGGAPYQTPNLDALAAGGVRFTQCHAQTVCTPTRVQLMTGRYNVRNYLSFGQMDPRCVTFGNHLGKAGYATAIAGKWQLGTQPDLPQMFGFQQHCLWQHTRAGGEKAERYRNAGLEIDGKATDYTDGTYGPDAVHRYALDFISQKHERPFFLYYPAMLVHSPFEPTPDSPDYGEDKAAIRKRKKQAGENATDPHFIEMVSYLDKQIGSLIRHLEERKLRESTLILFLGDNGTHKTIHSQLDGRPILGGKGETTVAALRVPMLANWPGKIAPGQICDDLIDTTDFVPTLAEAAGVALDDQEIDGVSFLPQLLGQPAKPREWFYCWYAPEDTMVAEFAADHHHKLTRSGDLFDLKTDPQELSPLAVSDAVNARQKLQAVLDRYQDARPADLPVMKPAKPKKKKKAPESVDASTFGFDPADATAALQAAIDSGAPCIRVKNMGMPWIVSPIKLRSDLELLFEQGVEVIAKAGAYQKRNDRMFQGIALKNVSLIGPGATLRMRKADYLQAPYEPSEFRHTLSFLSCENVRIEGLAISESGGDGIYIGLSPGAVLDHCRDVTIRGVTLENHYRQGISIISAENLLIENCRITGTSGTAPAAAIDFEPNAATQRLVNCRVRHSTFSNNRGGVVLCAINHLRSTTTPVDIELSDCTSADDDLAARLYMMYSDPVGGSVTLTGCNFTGLKRGGFMIKNKPVTGAVFRAVDCTMTKPWFKHTGGSPVGFFSEFPEVTNLGGAHFERCQTEFKKPILPLALVAENHAATLRGITGQWSIQTTKETIAHEFTSEVLSQWFPNVIRADSKGRK